jgi:hypothetical protein
MRYYVPKDKRGATRPKESTRCHSGRLPSGKIRVPVNIDPEDAQFLSFLYPDVSLAKAIREFLKGNIPHDPRPSG